MADAHKNAAYSLVATAPSPATSGTSLVVTAGEGARFPSAPFNATIWAAGAQPSFVAGGTTGGNFEIVRVTGVSTDTLTITRAQETTTARTVVVGDQIAATVTAKTLTDVEQTARSARSSNTILAASDLGQVIAATSAFTQTLTAAATLGAGWWCLIKNDTTDGTTVLVVDPNSSETIDGLTTLTMYSGDTRLLLCNGSNFTTVLFEGGFAKFTPTGGNFIVPSGIEEADVVCVGSGGQGGGGFSAAAGSGGGGGGGGALVRAILRAADLGSAGSTVTVTVAAGGVGSGTPGNAGANGGQTSFGTLLKAGGGGGGGAGASGAANSGGGGGSVVSSASTTTAGTPSSATAISGQAATSASSAAGNSAEYGGASGGGASGGSIVGRSGGSSIFGGPGGGSGGSTGNNNGGAGGATQAYAAGGGPSGGTGSASSPTKGGDGTFTGPYCGSAGGGGGTTNGATTAGAGGVGSIGAGGGGGGNGSGASSVGGTGGAGGAGECRVWYS